MTYLEDRVRGASSLVTAMENARLLHPDAAEALCLIETANRQRSRVYRLKRKMDRAKSAVFFEAGKAEQEAAAAKAETAAKEVVWAIFEVERLHQVFVDTSTKKAAAQYEAVRVRREKKFQALREEAAK